jgi:hypothetical protein
MRPTLNHPAEGHEPRVGRIPLGRAPITDRPRYGTTLRCSCGWQPGEGYTRGRVSNDPPSNGGRTVAGLRYQEHVASLTPG